MQLKLHRDARQLISHSHKACMCLVLQGFLAKALREAGSGSQSFLASMSSLTGRTPSHSESFKVCLYAPRGMRA